MLLGKTGNSYGLSLSLKSCFIRCYVQSVTRSVLSENTLFVAL